MFEYVVVIAVGVGWVFRFDLGLHVDFCDEKCLVIMISAVCG